MNIKEQYYYFKYGIQNLIKWFHIVWNDRDWDYSYIYSILKFKIDNQAEYMKSKDRFVNTQRYVEIMNLTSKLIQKCKDEYYDDECYGIKDSLIIILKYPLQYKKVILVNPEFIGNDKRIAIQICSNNQERCRKLLFKLLEQNIEKWWD